MTPDFAPWVMPNSGCVYETMEEYLARIEGQVLELALPQFSSFGPDGELMDSGLVSEATDIYQPVSRDDTNLLSIVVFDAGDEAPGPVSSTSVPSGYRSEVYASASSLYVVRNGWVGGESQTSILQFDIDAAARSVVSAAAGFSSRAAALRSALWQPCVPDETVASVLETLDGAWSDALVAFDNSGLLQGDGPLANSVANVVSSAGQAGQTAQELADVTWRELESVQPQLENVLDTLVTDLQEDVSDLANEDSWPDTAQVGLVGR
jgi:hypothetical protein